MRRIEEIECGVCQRHISSVVNEILNESSNHDPLGEQQQLHILLSKGVALIGVKNSNESRGGGYFELRPVVDGEVVKETSKRGGGALALLQTVWRTLKESELQSRSNPVQEIALGDLDRILNNHVADGRVPKAISSVSFPSLDSALKIEHPKTTTTNSTALSDVNFLTMSSPSDSNVLDRVEKCAMKETGIVSAQPYSLDLPPKKINIKTTTFDSSASTSSLASMYSLDDVGISTAFTKLGVGGRGPGQGNVESDNELLLFKAEASLEKGYRRLQESFGALQCNTTEFEKNGKSDFNPAFSQLQTTCEESILALFQSMTSMLHTLSILACIGFLADGKDPAAEAQKWVSMAWSEYEICLSALFEIVISAQEVKLCSSGTFRPIFLSLYQQNQVLAVVKSKKEVLENLHSTICDILRTPHVRSLFVKLDNLHMQWDSVLHNDSMYGMDDRAHILLLMRVETMDSELQLFMTERDLLNSARAAENKLGVYISDWEKRLDKIKDDLLEHSSIALAAWAYSQGPAMRFDISESEKLFKEQWDKDNESREFKQTVTQSEVSEIAEHIAQLKHRVVGLNKREQKEEKGHKKNLQQAALNSPNHNTSIYTQLMLEQERRRDETARELEHTANDIKLYKAYQNQFKVKYSLLIFLTSVLYRRFQCMRTFSAIIHARILARSVQENLLCGDVKMGEKRLAILAMSTLTEEVYGAATRWYSKQAARQLIEDEEREEIRRRKKGESEARRKAERLKVNATYRKEQRQQDRNNKIGSSGTEEATTAASITATSLEDNHSTTCSSNLDASPPNTELSLTDMPTPHSVESPYLHLGKKQMQRFSQCAVRVDNEGWEVMEEENDHEGFVNIISRFQKVKTRKGEREQKEKERRDKDRSHYTAMPSSIMKPPSSNASYLLSQERAGEGDSPCHIHQSSKEQLRGKRKAHTAKPQPRSLNKEGHKGVRGGELRDLAPSVNGGIEAGTSLPPTRTTTTAAEMLAHKELSTNGITSTTVKEIVGGGMTTTKECISPENLSRGVALIGKDARGTEAAAHTTTSTSNIVTTPEERAVTPPGLEMASKKLLPDTSVRLNPADADVQQKMEVEMCGGGGASSAGSCISKREEAETPLGFNSGEDLPKGICIQFGTVELSSEDLLMNNNSRNTGGRERLPVEEHVENEMGGDREELGISNTKDRKNKNANDVKLGNTEKGVDDRREELGSSTAMKMESIAKLKYKQDEEEVVVSGTQMPNTVAVDEVVVNEVDNAVGVGGPVSDTAVVHATSSRHPYPDSITDNKSTTTIMQEGVSGVNQPNKDDGSSHHQQPIIAHQMTSGIMPSNSPIVEGGVGTHSGPQHLNRSSPPQLVHPVLTAHPYPGQQLQQPQYVMPVQYQSTPGGYNYYHALHQSDVSNMSYFPVVNPQHTACPGGPYSEMQYELPQQGYFPQQGGEVGAPHHVYMGPGTTTHGGQQVWLCNGGQQWVMSPLTVPQRTPAVNQQATYMQQLQMGSDGYTLQPITAIEGGGYRVKQGGKNRKWKPRVGGGGGGGGGNRGRGRRNNVSSKYG